MKNYIDGLDTLKILLCILKDELDRDFITIYPKTMEVRVCFDKYITKQYRDVIA